LPSFFFAITYQITFALEDEGYKVHLLGPEDFAVSPVITFEHRFLPNLRTAIGERHLLLMLDEFEELEAAANKGLIDVSVFGFLRHLVQHHDWLSMILCGTHRMEELAADYWKELFNISLYKHVGFLERAEAMRLVQEPVARYNMRYDDLVLDKMWRVTAGHPYLLQLLCHNLVRHHNQHKRNYITIADLNAALDDILTTGEAHFSYLWTQSTDSERLILTALCRMIPITGQTTAVHVSDYLIAQRNFQMSRHLISETLERLANRDILHLRFLDDNLPAFSWKLGLLALWTEKKKSLSRVLEEFDG
jgi:hypothetical protein